MAFPEILFRKEIKKLINSIQDTNIVLLSVAVMK